MPSIFAFEDIHPQAPTHILICPRKHFVSLTDATAEDAAMLGRLQLVAAKLATERKLTDGYRRSSTMAAAPGSPCFISICICSAAASSAGRPDNEEIEER